MGAVSISVTQVGSAALVLNSPMPIAYTVTVNPIIARDDAGNNQATFMGSSVQETAIKGFVDMI